MIDTPNKPETVSVSDLAAFFSRLDEEKRRLESLDKAISQCEALAKYAPTHCSRQVALQACQEARAALRALQNP